jgi:hypothetical protein
MIIATLPLAGEKRLYMKQYLLQHQQQHLLQAIFQNKHYESTVIWHRIG